MDLCGHGRLSYNGTFRCIAPRTSHRNPGDVSNEYQVGSFFGTHCCGFDLVYGSRDAADGCLWCLDDANPSRQGCLVRVAACEGTVPTDSWRHRYRLPVCKSSVWIRFLRGYTICKEDHCDTWRRSALWYLQYFCDHWDWSKNQRYRADDGLS